MPDQCCPRMTPHQLVRWSRLEVEDHQPVHLKNRRERTKMKWRGNTVALLTLLNDTSLQQRSTQSDTDTKKNSSSSSLSSHFPKQSIWIYELNCACEWQWGIYLGMCVGYNNRRLPVCSYFRLFKRTWQIIAGYTNRKWTCVCGKRVW